MLVIWINIFIIYINIIPSKKKELICDIFILIEKEDNGIFNIIKNFTNKEIEIIYLSIFWINEI